VLISIPFLLFLLKLPKKTFGKLMLGVIPVYLGLLIFLSGIDYGFGFIGQYIGQMFFESSKPEWFKWLLLGVGFVLGGAITISEPAVTVLGVQIEELTNGHIKKMTIRITLALGIGVASLLSILKILTGINILWFLVPLYAISLIMMIFTPKLFVGLAFDSGGVTGGALTSAFLTPLTLSIAQAVATANGGEMSILTNGFGIISFISVTPLIAVQALGIIYNVCLKKAEREAQEESFEELEAFVTDYLPSTSVEDSVAIENNTAVENEVEVEDNLSIEESIAVEDNVSFEDDAPIEESVEIEENVENEDGIEEIFDDVEEALSELACEENEGGGIDE
jgi:hypothetical protein